MSSKLVIFESMVPQSLEDRCILEVILAAVQRVGEGGRKKAKKTS